MIRRLAFYAVAVCLLASLLPAADDPWDSGCEMVGLSSGGSIFQPSCSPHDPKILTVATDMGGSFITYDAGAKWHTIHFEQLSGSISASAAFHPKDPNVIYWVKGGCELRVTHDKGVHWAHVGAAQPWGDSQIIRIWLDPDYPDRIFVGTESKTFLSKDEGKSWAECAGVPGYLYRVVAGHGSPADKRVYLIGTSTGFYRSGDNGATFTKKVQGLSSDKLAGFAGGSNARGTMLYAAVPCELKDGQLTGGMFCSRDRGETWESCMTEGINRETKKGDDFGIGDLPQYGWMACSDTMPERAYVFCAGTNFRPPNHATIYRTDNAGKSWCAVLFSDPRFKEKGAECNVETDWQTECWGQREQGSMRGIEINAINPDMVVIDQERFVHVTMDAGKTWKSPYRGTFRVDSKGRKNWTTSGEVVTSSWNYYVDPFDKERHYIAYTDICLARSLDAGKTWMPEAYNLRKTLKKWVNTCYELAFDPEVSGRIWGAFTAMHDIPNGNGVWHGTKNGPGGIAVSDDHGEHWKPLTLPQQGAAMSVVIDPKSPKDKRTLYASIFGRGVYRSMDGGDTWEEKSGGFPDGDPKRFLKLILHKDGTLFVASTAKKKGSTVGVGVYRSTDKGDTWTRITEGQKWDWIRDYTVDPNDSRIVLVPTSRTDPGLHRTIDGGKTWETIYQNKAQNYFFGAYYHPTNNGWIYLTLGEDAAIAGIYLSKDNGKTWTPYSKIPFAAIQRVAFVPDDPKHIYLSTFGSSIIKAPVEP